MYDVAIQILSLVPQSLATTLLVSFYGQLATSREIYQVTYKHSLNCGGCNLPWRPVQHEMKQTRQNLGIKLSLTNCISVQTHTGHRPHTKRTRRVARDESSINSTAEKQPFVKVIVTKYSKYFIVTVLLLFLYE